ncbi:hypothetical protein BYT27DRAFT_7187970 [Phlegmacium glaucopus]|nr:hypothetical protein BYT27DRAFT_7187970 [Phlegmacium glaucopus]
MLLPYWNHTGQVHHLEAYPEVFHEWALGEEILADHQDLHNAVQEILNHAVIRTSCRAKDMNIVLDTTLDDGTSIIVRKRLIYISDPISESWSLKRFENEIQLLRWLREHSNIPVASILTVGPDFSIQEKMPGSTVGKQWHFFSSTAKDHFMSAYTSTVLEIFRLPVPQRIGSASFDAAGVMSVGSLIAANPTKSSSNNFDNIFEYFDFLITVKRQVVHFMKPEDQPRAEDSLSFVEAKTLSLLGGITDPLLLRCVLTHADLHNHNILATNDGSITAVLDWEINRIQPAILGAEYPLWLANKGPDDPRFASDNTWWEDSPAERQRICTQFEEMVQKRDSQFYKCLIEGRDLRSIAAWLTDPRADHGFDRMRSWATSQFSQLSHNP